MTNVVNFLQGIQDDYDAIPEKDPFTLYFVTDTHRIYLGDKLFAAGLIESLEQINAIELYGGSATDVIEE